jgi:hypothetical protein
MSGITFSTRGIAFIADENNPGILTKTEKNLINMLRGATVEDIDRLEKVLADSNAREVAEHGPLDKLPNEPIDFMMTKMMRDLLIEKQVAVVISRTRKQMEVFDNENN